MIGAGGRTLKYICNESQEALKEIFGKNFKIVLCAQVRSPDKPGFLQKAETAALLGYSLDPKMSLAEREKIIENLG